MKKVLLPLAICGLAAVAMATSAFSSVFVGKYKVKADSNLGKAKCLVCHASAKGGKLNPYGKQIKTAMGSGTKVTGEVLGKVEGQASAIKGMTNLAAIKADKLPGGN